MADRYFEPEDVVPLIPALTRIMERVRRAHAEAESGGATLRAEQQRIALAGGGVLDRDAWRATSARVDELRGVVQDGLREIIDLGGVPKDLALGLVDFRSLRGGREVNLCWKYGEDAVRWWHGLDEGYAARKPL